MSLEKEEENLKASEKEEENFRASLENMDLMEKMVRYSAVENLPDSKRVEEILDKIRGGIEEITKFFGCQKNFETYQIIKNLAIEILQDISSMDDVDSLDNAKDSRVRKKLQKLIEDPVFCLVTIVDSLLQKIEKPIFPQKNRNLYEQQFFIIKNEKILAGFEALLKEIKKLYVKKNNPVGRCFICYAWPIQKNMDEEFWVQPFLKIQYEHFKVAGLNPVLDIVDYQEGAIKLFLDKIIQSKYVALIYTKSLEDRFHLSDEIVTKQIFLVTKYASTHTRLPNLIINADALAMATISEDSQAVSGYLHYIKQALFSIYRKNIEDYYYDLLWENFARDFPVAIKHSVEVMEKYYRENFFRLTKNSIYQKIFCQNPEPIKSLEEKSLQSGHSINIFNSSFIGSNLSMQLNSGEKTSRKPLHKNPLPSGSSSLSSADQGQGSDGAGAMINLDEMDIRSSSGNFMAMGDAAKLLLKGGTIKNSKIDFTARGRAVINGQKIKIMRSDYSFYASEALLPGNATTQDQRKKQEVKKFQEDPNLREFYQYALKVSDCFSFTNNQGEVGKAKSSSSSEIHANITAAEAALKNGFFQKINNLFNSKDSRERKNGLEKWNMDLGLIKSLAECFAHCLTIARAPQIKLLSQKGPEFLALLHTQQEVLKKFPGAKTPSQKLAALDLHDIIQAIVSDKIQPSKETNPNKKLEHYLNKMFEFLGFHLESAATRNVSTSAAVLTSLSSLTSSPSLMSLHSDGEGGGSISKQKSLSEEEKQTPLFSEDFQPAFSSTDPDYTEKQPVFLHSSKNASSSALSSLSSSDQSFLPSPKNKEEGKTPANNVPAQTGIPGFLAASLSASSRTLSNGVGNKNASS